MAPVALVRWLPAVSWTAIVALLLALPGEEFSEVDVWDWLDKPVHAVLFAVHFALLATASRKRRPLFGAALGSSAFALLMETVQLWVPGRGWEWWDLGAGGAGIAVVAVWMRHRRATLRP